MHKADDSLGSVAERRRIQSVNVGFVLLRHLADAPSSMSLKDLCEAASMSSSQVHMYMASFLRERVVVQDPATARYDLGPYALDLGLAAMRKLDVLEVAKSSMFALNERTGESVFLTVWGNRGPTIVAKVDGKRRSAHVLRVGYVLPTLDSATGRLYLAYLPPDVTADVVSEERSDPTSPASALTDANIAVIVERAKRAGLGVHDGVRIDGFTGIAAPLIDHSGIIRAALTVTGPVQDFDGHEDSVIADRLRASAAEISTRLGH